jgi:hypothetical protein
LRDVQRQNATVYWLTYSPALTQYTIKPKTVHIIHKEEDGKLIENDVQPGEWDLIGALHELVHLNAPNIADLFSRVTRAHTMNFLKKSGVEDEIHKLGEEIYRQYIASFQPTPSEPGSYHAIGIAVKGHRSGRRRRAKDSGKWSKPDLLRVLREIRLAEFGVQPQAVDPHRAAVLIVRGVDYIL